MIVKDLQLEATLQAIPGILYRADTPPRFITRFISDELDRLLGFKPEDFINHESAWEDFLFEEDKEKTLKALNAFFASKETIRSFEYRLWKAGRKEYCWIRDRVSVIRDETGAPLELYGVMLDITEAKEMSIELEMQRRILDKIYQAAPIGIGLAVNRIFQHVNQGLCSMLGYTRSELLGQNAQLIYRDNSEYERVGKILYPKDGDGHIQTVDTRLKTKAGDSVDVTMSILPLDGKSFIGGVAFSITDVSHIRKIQKELEIATVKAVESERLKSAFLANMSHEIRTPMNAIVGFSELLDELDLLPDLKSMYIRQIQQNSDQLLHIVNDILDLSRIDSGEVQVVKEPVVVKEFLDDLQQSYEMQALKKDVKVVRNRDGKTVHYPVMMDKAKVRQVLDNLMTNAIKFTDNGYIVVGYDVVDQEIHFVVEDTGVGIPLEKAEMIFDRFYQEENYLSKNYRGAGLGLSICKKLVNLMGGDIHVSSTINKGSKFWFSIPLVKA